MMPFSVTEAAFAFGLVLLLAALVGRDLKIMTIELPGLTGIPRIAVGVLGAVLVVAGLNDSGLRQEPETALVEFTTQDELGLRQEPETALVEFTTQNDSAYEIRYLYLSSTQKDSWGPDRLNDHILKPGTEYTITDLLPGKYDIRFVDNDKDECILKNIDIFKDTSWVLTSDWLTKCEVYR
jgi:hypothetical protein